MWVIGFVLREGLSNEKGLMRVCCVVVLDLTHWVLWFSLPRHHQSYTSHNAKHITYYIFSQNLQTLCCGNHHHCVETKSLPSFISTFLLRVSPKFGSSHHTLHLHKFKIQWYNCNWSLNYPSSFIIWG